jgi:outer membrane protein OmpA-like peptidoglycan-associated protein
VVGHTDRIGSETDNRLLSQQRAQTVRELLVRSGVDGDRISAFGLGESQPLKQCSDSLSGDELVACLQPNRRVEVIVTGYR